LPTPLARDAPVREVYSRRNIAMRSDMEKTGVDTRQ